MFNLTITLLKYTLAWATLMLTLMLSIIIESVSYYSSRIFKWQAIEKKQAAVIPYLKNQLSTRVILPNTSSVAIVIWAPILALSALFPVCASIPFFSFFQIMDKSSDLLQITQFFMLSDVFAIIAIFALGTKQGNVLARRMLQESVVLLFSLMALFTLTAISTTGKFATITNVFRLNLTEYFGFCSNTNLISTVAFFIFLLAILILLPHDKHKQSTMLINTSFLKEFQGVPRLVISLWSIFRSFLITSLIIMLVCPFQNLELKFKILNFTWISPLASFFIYLIIIIITRAVITPILWLVSDKLKALISEKLFLTLISLFLFLIIITVLIFK